MSHEKSRDEAVELPQSSADNNVSPTPDTNPIESLPEKLMTLKLISSGLSFFVAGVNDGSLGALIPYFITSYHLDTGTVTIMQVLPPVISICTPVTRPLTVRRIDMAPPFSAGFQPLSPTIISTGVSAWAPCLS